MNVNRITQDKIQAEARAKALEEQEQKERQRVVSILMDHGVTAAQSRAVSKRASDVESRSSRSISAVREMIDDYEHEVEGFKSRIAVMQMAEVERLQKEIAYREELAANHGKPKSFWKVPVLNTLKRQHVR